jgi:hypothetical protein
MAKTLHHFSQQIRSLAVDAGALDRAREIGLLLIEAKAAVKAAGKAWGTWLKGDCELSDRTAQRYMAIASRWDELAKALKERPNLSVREADKVLAAAAPRKEQPEPTPLRVVAEHGRTAGFALSQAGDINGLDAALLPSLVRAMQAVLELETEIAQLQVADNGTPQDYRLWMASTSINPPRCEVRVGDLVQVPTGGPHVTATVVSVAGEQRSDEFSAEVEFEVDGVMKERTVGWKIGKGLLGLTDREEQIRRCLAG